MATTRIFLFIMLAFFLSNSGHATTVERLNLDTLVKKSNRIVIGKVRRSRTYWSSNGKLILTNYTIDVQETMKGQAASTIELTTIGGQIGDLTLHVAGMPVFATDENAVVFVESTGTYSTVVGLAQGKFAISNGEVSNDVTGLEFPSGDQVRATKMPLATFKRQIKLSLDRHTP
jgi:hypothetical protein